MVVSNIFYFHLGGRFQFWLIFLKWVVQPPTSMETFFKMMLLPTTGWFHPTQIRGSKAPSRHLWVDDFPAFPFGGICDRFLEGKHIVFSDSFLGSTNGWLVFWIGGLKFLGFPYERDCYLWVPLESQTTVCPIEASKASRHPGRWQHGSAPFWLGSTIWEPWRCDAGAVRVGSWGNKIWIDCWF